MGLLVWVSSHSSWFWNAVKCEKMLEVTLGTPDVKSGPTRC